MSIYEVDEEDDEDSDSDLDPENSTPAVLELYEDQVCLDLYTKLRYAFTYLSTEKNPKFISRRILTKIQEYIELWTLNSDEVINTRFRMKYGLDYNIIFQT